MSAPVRSDWSSWSVERERKRIAHDIAERSRVVNTAVYPSELAKQLAHDAAKMWIPDWRLLRAEHAGLIGRLIQQQPELAQREVKQLDKVIALVTDNLPKHLQPLITDLRTIFEFRAVAREAAAYHFGIETGRVLAGQYVDTQGRRRRRRDTADLRLTDGGAK